MATRLKKELGFLTRTLRRDEATLLAEALEQGIYGMFIRHVRDRHMRAKLSRREAVKLVGAQALKVPTKPGVQWKQM